MLNAVHEQLRMRYRTLAFLLFLSSMMAIASAWIVRRQSTVVGNLCAKTPENPVGHCYEMQPIAGYPFSYWRDIGGISVEGKLGPEDELLVTHFAADCLIWFLFLAMITVLIKIIKTARSTSPGQ